MATGKFSAEHVKTITSLCMQCAHRSTKAPGLCLAFPEGIPTKYLLGEEEHTKSVKGDGGIVFEAKPSAE